MYLNFRYFIYSNWYLFFILGLDFITSLNITYYSNKLSINDTNLIIKYDSYIDNVIFLIAPLGNISLRLSKENISIRKLIEFNLFLIFVCSFISKKYLINIANDELSDSEINNIFLIGYKLFTSTMISIVNYYLIGSNNVSILLKFNIFNMIFNFINYRYLIGNMSLFNKIIFISIVDFMSIFYILLNIKSSHSKIKLLRRTTNDV